MPTSHTAPSQHARRRSAAAVLPPVASSENRIAVSAEAAQIGPLTAPDPETRLSMIAEAAYYSAEQRGFAAGGEVDDWLRAEAEIDRRLRS